MRYLALFLVFVILLTSLTAFASEGVSEELTENQKIVKEVAYAYFRKGTKIHYDQATKTARRQIYASPEEPSAQRRVYLDCSGYANAIYYEAFGEDVLPTSSKELRPSTANFYSYSTSNKTDDVIDYWDIGDYKNNTTALQTEVKNLLRVGDVFTLRYNNGTASGAGHTLIYVGENEEGEDVLLHCYGGDSYTVNSSDPTKSYDLDAWEEETPVIAELKVDDLFENEDERYYLFRKTNPIEHICILRPLERGFTPTDKTKSRMKIKGLSMEKTSVPYEHKAVNTGDSITYTISLDNTTSKTIENVTITDTVPDGTAFKEGSDGVKCENGEISWTGSVAANTTVNVSYTVTVTATTSTVITSNATSVSGVALGTIKHTLSLLTKEQLKKVADTALSYVENKTTFDSKVKFPTELYKEALGVEFFNYTSATKFFDDIIDSANHKFNEKATDANIVVPDFYGGVLSINSSLDTDNERTRLISEEELSVGDIIFANYKPGTTNLANIFVYVGNSTLVTLPASNSPCEAVTIGDNIYGVNADNVLISLFGYNRFAVVRPSMIHTSDVFPAGIINMDGSTVKAQIDEAGDYDVVIADFEGDVLQNIEIIEQTVTETGITDFERKKSFSLSKDDKIMLFKDFKKLIPLGSAYVFKEQN